MPFLRLKAKAWKSMRWEQNDIRYRRKALKVIEYDAVNNPNGVMRLGNQKWLEEYYLANPDDRPTE